MQSTLHADVPGLCMFADFPTLSSAKGIYSNCFGLHVYLQAVAQILSWLPGQMLHNFLATDSCPGEHNCCSVQHDTMQVGCGSLCISLCYARTPRAVSRQPCSRVQPARCCAEEESCTDCTAFQVLESKARIKAHYHLNFIQSHPRCPQACSARVAACPQ